MESILNKYNQKMAPSTLWNNSSSLYVSEDVNVFSRESDLNSYNPTLDNFRDCNLLVTGNDVISLSKRDSSSDTKNFTNCDKKPPELTSFGSIFSSGSSDSEKKKPKIPDGGWGWVVVFSSFVISMIADGISFSFGLLYIEFLNHFQESKSKTSWIGSLFMAVPLLSGPVMSALVDRYGCRKMTMLGGLISGVGFVLASFGDSIEFELIFFGFVAGVGLGLCYVTAVVSIAYWFDKYRTLAIGLGACGTGVGTFVYAPFTQFLIEEYGWRGSVLILAGTFFNMCVCGAVMRDPEWWTLEQIKQNSLKSIKTVSSGGSISLMDGFPNKENLEKILKKGESPEYILTTLVTTIEKSTNGEKNNTEGRDQLPMTRSLVNLPTFMKQNEKVPLEVLEQLSNNKTVLNIILENYPFLLHCRSISNDERLNQLSTEVKPNPITMSMKLKRSQKEDPLDIYEIINRSSEEFANDGKILGNNIKQNVAIIENHTSSAEKRPVVCRDTGQHYLRGIRLHRNSVVYRGAMMNIPRYRLRASSCPDIFRNSTTTIARENEKWYSDSLELFKMMFDFSMFLELHFLLMSLATILLFTWFIVPYFYLAEHLTRHGYSEVEGSFLLSIIGVTNCLGMVGLGWAGDQPWMSITKTYAGCLIFCGLSCILMPLFTTNFNVLAAVCALFGLFFASNYSFTPSILVQLIPLEKFTTAYGLILLCQGIGNLVGPPLSGWIFDLTGEWDISFYLAGAWIIISGLLIVLIQVTGNRKIWRTGRKS